MHAEFLDNQARVEPSWQQEFNHTRENASREELLEMVHGLQRKLLAAAPSSSGEAISDKPSDTIGKNGGTQQASEKTSSRKEGTMQQQAEVLPPTQASPSSSWTSSDSFAVRDAEASADECEAEAEAAALPPLTQLSRETSSGDEDDDEVVSATIVAPSNSIDSDADVFANFCREQDDNRKEEKSKTDRQAKAKKQVHSDFEQQRRANSSSLQVRKGNNVSRRGSQKGNTSSAGRAGTRNLKQPASSEVSRTNNNSSKKPSSVVMTANVNQGRKRHQPEVDWEVESSGCKKHPEPVGLLELCEVNKTDVFKYANASDPSIYHLGGPLMESNCAGCSKEGRQLSREVIYHCQLCVQALVEEDSTQVEPLTWYCVKCYL